MFSAASAIAEPGRLPAERPQQVNLSHPSLDGLWVAWGNMALQVQWCRCRRCMEVFTETMPSKLEGTKLAIP